MIATILAIVIAIVVILILAIAPYAAWLDGLDEDACGDAWPDEMGGKRREGGGG